MLEPLISLCDKAEFYHRQLPASARRYLNGRGIPDTMIERYMLGWDGKAITIPIEDRQGEVVFLKTAKRTSGDTSAPVVENPPGAPMEVFPWASVRREPARIVIVANELDCLVLEARGFLAVCSTAAADGFKAEWAKHFDDIDRVYLCLGRDAVRAAERVAALIPKAKIVRLSEALGPRGSVTEFFVRLRKKAADFEKLLSGAKAIPSVEAADTPPPIARFLKHAERLKAEVPIARVVSQYTTLRPDAKRLVGRCPLHDDPKQSFNVYPRTNTFHCFGCGAGGDAITFLEKKHNLTFGQALEALENIRYANDFPNVA